MKVDLSVILEYGLDIPGIVSLKNEKPAYADQSSSPFVFQKTYHYPVIYFARYAV
jgi:hypothetical protein